MEKPPEDSETLVSEIKQGLQKSNDCNAHETKLRNNINLWIKTERWRLQQIAGIRLHTCNKFQVEDFLD